jgi:alpha-tubulin suppressor-like RCC1 family protein
MINSQNLIDKVCARIACGGMTDLETCQTTGALNILSNPVVSVATFSALPSATLYQGRMIYVDDENRYYHALFGLWNSDLTSMIKPVTCGLYGWGGNTYGVLLTGDTTSTCRSSPTSSTASVFNDWCRVEIVAPQRGIGLRCNGTIWTWGNNSSGQLGDGTTVVRSSPVSVVGGFTDWVEIATHGPIGGSATHTLARRANGTLWAWGAGSYGRLGDGTTISKSSPVSVVGGFTDWCRISTGQSHSVALRTNGTIWTWGGNSGGRIGDGTTTDRSSPVSVVGGFTDWCQIGTGLTQSFGIRTGGTLWAWGCNNCGQLGDGTVVNRCSPVSVVGGFTDWCQVDGFCHTVAIRTNGTAWAWGANGSGRLGDGTTTAQSSPVSVIGGFTDWCQISGGEGHTLGLRTNGTLWAWGAYQNGALGDGIQCNRSSPVSVAGGLTWTWVSAGSRASMGIALINKGF